MNKLAVCAFFVLILAALLMPGQTVGRSAVGAETGGNIVYAASCSQEHVQAAIDDAGDGDFVLVPAGTCEWTTLVAQRPSVLIDEKSITLQGAGIDQTIIVDQTGSQYNEFALKIDGVEGKPVRITGFTFEDHDQTRDPFSIVGVAGTCKSFRIDHCTFSNLVGPRAIMVTGYTYGVIDHCTFIAPEDNTVQSITVVGDDEASWKRPLELGTGHAVYVEDCYFDFAYRNDGPIDSNNGSRWVFRYNTVENSGAANHSACTSGGRGGFSSEVYENTFIGTHASVYNAVRLRSGTGVIFNNTIQSLGTYNHGIVVDNYRTYYANCPAPLNSRCDGNSPLDGNTPGGMGYPCLDQIGRATDAGPGSIYGDPTGIHPQALEPVYEWGNTFDGEDADIVVLPQGATNPSMSDHIQEGRDYFNDTVRPGYTPYVYPHLLTRDLVLTGTAASGAAGLDWEVVTAFSFPISTIWRIEYAARSGAPIMAATGLVSPTRVYTVTGLAANTAYSVTLSGMVPVPWGDPVLWASVTTVVTPTGLSLRGRPGDAKIYLDWEIAPAPPSPTTTWRMDYYSQTVTLSEGISASVARSHTLTGLTNYAWYTVTLHAMLGGTSWLSDTVRVMPTDKFVYLPLILRGH